MRCHLLCRETDDDNWLSLACVGTNFVFYLFTVTDLNYFGFPDSDKYIFELLSVITLDANSISDRLAVCRNLFSLFFVHASFITSSVTCVFN